ncbi:MAG: class I SAM-dependent methyltransferase [Victivallales bacterium]|nr:class I SAM-dependent methyltransferase [Victivallales bacterium]
MNPSGQTEAARIEENSAVLQRYYRMHSCIYDLTRWLFLFGRDECVTGIRVKGESEIRNILEIGCGTGRNLKLLGKHFPEARLTGVDISEDMLKVARKSLPGEVSLLKMCYSAPLEPGGFDLVLCSYMLSMLPDCRNVLDCACEDLRTGGILSAVDFHATRWGTFRRWMEINHVRMEGQLLPELQRRLKDCKIEIKNAYLCFWEYMLFKGRRG